MNIQTLAMPLITIPLLAFSASSTLASMYQEQTQKSSQTYSFSSSCEGDKCNDNEVKFKSKSSLKQSQSQSYGQTYTKRNVRNYSYSNNHGIRPRYGSTTVSWDHRGGTCHIRYSESNVSNYKYATSAACDEGSATIGGLQRGTTYRFQVRKETGDWSSPIWLRSY